MGDETKAKRQPTRYAVGGVTLDDAGNLTHWTTLGVGAGTNVEDVIGIVASEEGNRDLAASFNHFGGIPLRNLTVVPGKAGFGIVTGDKLSVDDLFENDSSEADAELEALAARAASDAAAEAEADAGDNGAEPAEADAAAIV